jgi:tetratricopeptide (TPR) repeat protein
MADRLRTLWDFDDLDPTERRLREQLAREADDAARAEVLTQLARVEGLRGDVDAGERLIEEAAARAGDDATALARIDLERGRLRRSSGNLEAALPLFASAFETSLEARAYFIAADATHMAALAAPDRSGFLAWTTRGVELAEAQDEARYWLGPLLNNLGWGYFENGEYEPALNAFERALRARERDPDDRRAIEIARFAVGKALRALGRSQEAVPLLEQAVAWAQSEGAPDGWFHEELAEEYAAVGRASDAREQARLALPLLLEADPSFAGDGERAARLRSIADD